MQFRSCVLAVSIAKITSNIVYHQITLIQYPAVMEKDNLFMILTKCDIRLDSKKLENTTKPELEICSSPIVHNISDRHHCIAKYHTFT